MSATFTPDDTDDERTDERSKPWVRWLFLIGVLGFAAFWIWALFFASKESVNRIDDRAWAERAEQICVDATERRLALSDWTRIDQGGPELIRRRADIVDQATDIIERMLDDVVAVTPTDPKGQEIVPLWEAEYRIYLQDRRNYSDELRATGENLAFYETAIDGLPITERVITFASDNEMDSCAPPADLAA